MFFIVVQLHQLTFSLAHTRFRKPLSSLFGGMKERFNCMLGHACLSVILSLSLFVSLSSAVLARKAPGEQIVRLKPGICERGLKINEGGFIEMRSRTSVFKMQGEDITMLRHV